MKRIPLVPLRRFARAVSCVFACVSLSLAAGAAPTRLLLEMPAQVIEKNGPQSATVRLDDVAPSAVLVHFTSGSVGRLRVTESVYVQAGASSATFNLVPVVNPYPNVPVVVGVTAFVEDASLQSAQGSVEVIDQGDLTLAIEATGTLPEGRAKNIVIKAGVLMPQALTVTIASSDESVITSGVSAVIPKDADSVTVPLTAVQNALQDGERTVTLTPQASGFTGSPSVVRVADDDPVALECSALPASVVAGTAIPVMITARAIDGTVAAGLGSNPVFSVAQATGTPSYTSGTRTFVDGVSSFELTVTSASPTTTFLVQAGGAEVTSPTFAVSPAPASLLTLGPVPPSAVCGEIVPLTLAATDAFGNPAADVSGPVKLLADVVRDSGTALQGYPYLSSSASNFRLQSVYRASQIGGSGLLRGLEYEFRTTPPSSGEAIIRVQQVPPSATFLRNFTGAGWTEVYRGGHPTAVGTRVRYDFNEAFPYDGTSDLLVDICYLGTVPALTLRTDTIDTNFALRASNLEESLLLGAPLFVASNVRRPVVGFVTTDGVSVATSGPAAFAGVLWSGGALFSQPGQSVYLQAHVGALKVGSTPINVSLPVPAVSPVPAVTGGDTLLLGWTPLAFGGSAELVSARDALFTTDVAELQVPYAAGLLSLTSLAEGPLWLRARASAAVPQRHAWLQTQSVDFEQGTHVGTTPYPSGGNVALRSVPSALSDEFDQAGNDWVSTLLLPRYTPVPASRSDLGAGPVPTPSVELPVQAGGDKEAVFTMPIFLDGSAETAATDVSVEFDFAVISYVGGSLNFSVLERYAAGTALAALLVVRADGTIAADLSNGLSASPILYPTSTPNTFPFVVGENFHLSYAVEGDAHWLRISRLVPDGATLREEPVLATAGRQELRRWLPPAWRRSGIVAFSTSIAAGNVLAIDNLRIARASGLVETSGTYTALVSPTLRSAWGTLDYETSTPAGTTLAVDLLRQDGSVIATDLASGVSVAGLPGVPANEPLKLRARLSTSDPAVTPSLLSWKLGYDVAPPQARYGAWSTILSTVLDATAPSLAAEVPATTSAPVLALAGSAYDLNGVASVLVNGVPAASTDGFATFTASLVLVPGANTVTLRATDTAVPAQTRELVRTIDYTPSASADYDGDGLPDAWELEHGLEAGSAAGEHGADGDLDGDGLANRLEYALGGDPRTAGRAPLSLGRHAGPGGTQLEVTFRRSTTALGGPVRLEVSGDLTTWAAPASAPELLELIADPATGTESVTYRLAPPADPEAPQFVRLAVGP